MSLKGQLLVAAPILGDPNFERAVVLMLEHNDDGALGVVLNRPTGYRVAEPLPAWEAAVGEPEVVFKGGPVSPSSVIGLGRVGGAGPGGAHPGFQPVLDGGIGVVDLSAPPGAEIVAARVFAGYAGWGTAQLELELAQDAWYVVDAEGADVFTAAPGELWRAVLSRQPGGLAKVALVPDDPTLN